MFPGDCRVTFAANLGLHLVLSAPATNWPQSKKQNLSASAVLIIGPGSAPKGAVRPWTLLSSVKEGRSHTLRCGEGRGPLAEARGLLFLKPAMADWPGWLLDGWLMVSIGQGGHQSIYQGDGWQQLLTEMRATWSR